MFSEIPSPVWLSLMMLVSLVIIGVWGLNYRSNDPGTRYDGNSD